METFAENKLPIVRMIRKPQASLTLSQMTNFHTLPDSNGLQTTILSLMKVA